MILICQRRQIKYMEIKQPLQVHMALKDGCSMPEPTILPTVQR